VWCPIARLIAREPRLSKALDWKWYASFEGFFMSCGCQGNGSTDLSSIIVNTCCGAPEPTGGWSTGIDFVGVIDSNDLTAGADLVLYTQGTTGSVLAAPSSSQRLYIFHISAVVGAAGNFKLFSGVTANQVPGGPWATIVSGLLAKYGGIVTKLPNRRLPLNHTLHASHDVAGRVVVTVLGKLVTEA
jgi:hypothetical protein